MCVPEIPSLESEEQVQKAAAEPSAKLIMRNRWLQRKRKIFLMRKKNTVMTPLNSRKRMRMTLSAVSSVMILMKPWKEELSEEKQH